MRRLPLTVVVLAALLPLLPLLVLSWTSSWRYPDLLPDGPTSRGLALVVSGDSLAALGTSVLVATTVGLLATAIGLPAGRLLGVHRFPGRTALRGLLLAPLLVPALATTLGLQVFFIRVGLSDSVAGVVLVQLVPTVPYAVAVLTAAYAGHDLDLERAARTLGAGPARTLWHVTLPAMAPAVGLSVLLTFLVSWSEYVLTLLIGGGQVRTLPLLLFAAIGSSDRTAAAALGLLVALPPVALVALVVRVGRSVRGTAPGLVGLARA